MAGQSLRLGVVGANVSRGWARDAHLPAFSAVRGISVTAVSARSPELAAEAARAFGATNSYGDSLELVRDPDVDVVVVTVRVQEHRAVVLAALAAGKDVYCEWPLGRNVEEAEEMVAAIQPGQRTFIGAQGVSAPAIRHAMSLLRDGAIGKPLILRAYNTAAPWGPSTSGRSYLQDKNSGATLATIGMGHMLAVIDALIGPWLEVDARGSILYPKVQIEGTEEFLDRDCSDHLMVLGRHESGCVSTLEVVGGSTQKPASIEIVGERGWMRIVGMAPGTIQIASLLLESSVDESRVPAAVAPELTGPSANLAEVWAAMRAEFEGRQQGLPDFRDALRLTRLIQAIDVASETGQRQFLADQ